MNNPPLPQPIDVWDTTPDYVNERGVKWWHDLRMTNFVHDIGLEGGRCWYVETGEGRRARLYTVSDAIMVEDQTLDGFITKLHALFRVSVDQYCVENHVAPDYRPESIRLSVTE